MCRFAALSFFAVVYPVAWCALAPQFSAADPPAAENPFDSGPPAAAADSSPFDAAPAAAAAPFDQAPRARSKKGPTPSLDSKIGQALQRPTRFEFVETPLQDAVEFLKDQHDIEIQLDMRALEEAGIGSDTPITRTLKDISLASALRMLLDNLDATFVVRDGVLLITTQDVAAKMVDLRVYGIGELVDSQADANELAEVLRALFTDASVSRHPASASARAASDKGAAATVRRTVHPAASRFDVLPYRNLLIVQASQQDHESLTQLLGEIKAKLKNEK